MATRKEQLNKGQDYKAVITPDKDTSSYTIEAFAYDKLNPSSENNIGSTSGQNKNEDIGITLTTSNLSNGTYILEIWATLNGNKQFLVYPNEKEEFILQINNRQGV